MNETIQKAADALRETCGPQRYRLEVAERMNRLGLLATPEMVAAAQACEEYVREWDGPATGFSERIGREQEKLRAAGRALIAAKRPTYRYAIKRVSEAFGDYAILNERGGIEWTGFTEAQARAVAKALNEVQP